MPDKGQKRQLPALTGLRFFLALWVVVYHQNTSVLEWIGRGGGWQQAVAALVTTGYSAVSFFFILSGFVLAYNYDLAALRSTGNLRRFAVARFSRIYPAYLIGLVLLLPFLFYRLKMGTEGSLTVDLANLGLSLALLQAWVPASARSWNFPGWSLSNEAFFYAVLPLIGGWLWRMRRTEAAETKLSGAILLAACFWMLSLVMPFYAVATSLPHFGHAAATDMELTGAGWWAEFIRYDPLLRLPDFCVGILLARIYRAAPVSTRLHNRGARFYLPGMAIGLCALACAEYIDYPFMHNGLLIPAFAMIILGLALEGGAIVRFLSRPSLVFLGNASYSMYILHVPVYAWLGIAFNRLLGIDPHGLLWMLSYVTAVVLVSSLCFRFVEDPAHRWLKRRLNRRLPPASQPPFSA